MASDKTRYVSTILLSAALVHCGRDKAPEPAASAPPPEPVATAAPPLQEQQMTPASGPGDPSAGQASAAEPAATPAPLADEEIFELIDLANTSEVDQAKVAQTKAKSAKVKNFAAMMIAHHTKAKDKGSKLSTKLGVTPAESSMSNQLKSESEATTLTLKSAPATDFDRVYMDSQVDAHLKVLSTLDERLIPSAKDPELKALLEDMRATVDKHLQEAQQIQSALAAAAPKG